MFNKILIANRGEIACRIQQTAQAMGIATVAIYSDIDAQARHVEMADQAFCVGPAPSQDSYLQIEKIIEIAKLANVDAIHPGYGFLSENAEFARRCEAENIIFIGPPADAIEAMGSKSAAKALMDQAKVPTVPGYHGDEQDPKFLAQKADEMGFPLLIKAVSGGGGKGMRIVSEKNQFNDALKAAQREALSSFADQNVLLEKYLLTPRHIEVQILADQNAHVVCLSERDCSIQRRHQKIIEEAPAPGLSDDFRQRLAKAASDAAKSIDYVGAGTIEFLVDGDDFYFMEMNTRLQVEHGVTELITDCDLVEWQIRIALGESLEHFKVEVKGHALEARIYAEDPYQAFLPVTGTLGFLQTPKPNRAVRIDSALREGDDVSIYYDPMISKLMVWANTREQAIQQMQMALSKYLIAGLTTNIDFLTTCFSHPDFQAAKLSTNFIAEHPELFEQTDDQTLAFALASVYLQASQSSEGQHHHDRYSPWNTNDSWRMNLQAEQFFYFIDQGKLIAVTLKSEGDHHTLRFSEGQEIVITANCRHPQIDVTFNHQHYHCTVAHLGDTLTIFGLGQAQQIHCFDPIEHYAQEENAAGHLTAPMPGTVIAVLADKGGAVEQGAQLITIEAMKMEHTLIAPSAGTVTDIYFKTGDQVAEGDQLLGFEVHGS